MVVQDGAVRLPVQAEEQVWLPVSMRQPSRQQAVHPLQLPPALVLLPRQAEAVPEAAGVVLLPHLLPRSDQKDAATSW